MSIESTEGDGQIPDFIPDFREDSELDLIVTYHQLGVRSRIQALSEKSGVDPQEIFLRLATFGINSDYPNSSEGLYRRDDGYSTKIDLSDEKFAEDPDMVSTKIEVSKLPKLSCQFSSRVHRGLMESSTVRNIPVVEIIRRATRLSIAVMEDITIKGGRSI